MATSYLETYNPKKPAPKKKVTQGVVAPVVKRSNPFIHPLPGGGSGPVAPPMASTRRPSVNQIGAQAQINAQVNRPPVQTGFSFNYESDPVLARIRALGGQNVNNAKTEAAMLRKQAILDTGMADVGREIGVDEATNQAAASNPISLMSELARQFTTRGRDLDESLNQQNLFWSGHRANQLGELAENRGLSEAAIARDLRAALGGIDQGVLAAEESARLQEQAELERVAQEQQLAAMQKAYFDALNAAAPGTSVESGVGGFIPAPLDVAGQPSGGVSYAPGPTPEQVQNMNDIGIDPATSIYAPQPTMIQGPNNMPELFGGQPSTVAMPSIPGATDIISSRSVSPVTLPEDLAPPAPSNVSFNSGSLPMALSVIPPYVPPQLPPPLPPVDYEADNLLRLLALQQGRNFF